MVHGECAIVNFSKNYNCVCYASLFLTCPRPRPEGLPCNWKWPACAILIKIHNLENCILRKILIMYTFICVCFYISYLPVNLNLSTNALCTLFASLSFRDPRFENCLPFCNASSLQGSRWKHSFRLLAPAILLVLQCFYADKPLSPF